MQKYKTLGKNMGKQIFRLPEKHYNFASPECNLLTNNSLILQNILIRQELSGCKERVM